jgi:hypothetical protein
MCGRLYCKIKDKSSEIRKKNKKQKYTIGVGTVRKKQIQNYRQNRYP